MNRRNQKSPLLPPSLAKTSTIGPPPTPTSPLPPSSSSPASRSSSSSSSSSSSGHRSSPSSPGSSSSFSPSSPSSLSSSPPPSSLSPRSRPTLPQLRGRPASQGLASLFTPMALVMTIGYAVTRIFSPSLPAVGKAISSFLFLPHSSAPVALSFRPNPSSSSEDSRIPIVTTIFPLLEFTRAVAGERGEVSLLLPPGAGVHTWQPRASDIRRLHQTRLLVIIGAGLEPWVKDILASLPPPGPTVIAATESLPLIEESEKLGHHGHEPHGHETTTQEREGDGRDPHVWLDFGLAQQIVDRIATALSQLDPAGAAFYAANASSYKARLAALDARFEKALASCRHRVLLIGGHAAFGYLARRYRLEQIALYGLSPDAEPTPGRMVSAIERARRLGVRAVFAEANTNPRLARTLAREVGAEVLVLNPASSPTRKQLSTGATFFDIMEENLQALRKGLGCD